MVEAGRLLSTFCQLSDWVNPKIEVRTVFSDPILGAPKGEYNIYTDYEIKTKAFFYAPSKATKSDYSLAINLVGKNKEMRTLKKELHELFSKAYLFFSAVNNNTPLVLYTFEPHTSEEIKGGIRKILEVGWSKVKKDYRKGEPVSKDAFVKAIFLLAIYMGIIRAMEHCGIQPKGEVSVSEIEEVFCKKDGGFYSIFSMELNRSYLRHEISNNFERTDVKDKIRSTWHPFSECIGGDGGKDDVHPRNFIAHCGFERNCLEVMRKENMVFLRYREDAFERIQEILWKN